MVLAQQLLGRVRSDTAACQDYGSVPLVSHVQLDRVLRALEDLCLIRRKVLLLQVLLDYLSYVVLPRVHYAEHYGAALRAAHFVWHVPYCVHLRPLPAVEARQPLLSVQYAVPENLEYLLCRLLGPYDLCVLVLYAYLAYRR